MTAFAFALQYRNDNAGAHERFTRMAADGVRDIREQLETAAAVLRMERSLLQAGRGQGASDADAMQTGLEPSRLLPGYAATWIARRQGTGGDGHYVVESAFPQAGAVQVGRDLAPDLGLPAKADSARTDDAAVLTGSFDLDARGPARTRAFAVLLPMSGKDAGGAAADVGVALRLDRFVAGALTPDKFDAFRVRVEDLTAPGGATLYDSGGATTWHAPAYGGTLRFGGREWRLALQPHHAELDARTLWYIGIGGGLLSLLLGALLWSFANTRRRALAVGAQMSERYRESEQRLRALNDVLPVLVVLADAASGRIHYANRGARERLGEEVGDGVALASLFDDPRYAARLAPGGDIGDWRNVETRMRSLHGNIFWADASISAIDGRAGREWLMVARDISEQRQLTELLSYQASHDSLTELYNRREFERRLERALRAVERGGAPFAVLYIDLDQFKLINDTSGHIAGDQLLVQLALAMGGQLRSGDIIARLGGDEFGVLGLESSREGALALAERLRGCIESYLCVWEQRTYTVSASIGVVLVDRPGVSTRMLLSQADAACYLAKERGRNRAHLYSEQDSEAIRRRNEMEWAQRLREMIDQQRLRLVYQEMHPLQGQATRGPHIELLLRAQETDGSLVLPGAFMPAAERYGLVAALDRWVVGEAIAHFDRLHPAGCPGRCSLNLSASSLEESGIAEHILGLLDRHGVDPTRVCFEITETEAVRNLPRALRLIERLRSAGCSVALDDFGAGMASFGYLKNLPVDVIKIDGSFIRGLQTDAVSRSIVEVVARIGHQLGLEVVAEWVEDADTLAILRKLGVDFGQGFALQRPEPVAYQRDITSGARR